jgi:hypothetical protein
MSTRPTDPDDIADALAAPFEPGEVKFRAGATNQAKTKALALPYIDARVVQDRLDDVLGAHNWQASFRDGKGGSVVCSLCLRVGGEWIAKEDTGGESEQPDGGDRVKAAFSDALKRAAVQWGVGRYLYRLPQTWVDYDAQKKQLKETPKLPAPKAAPQPKKEAPVAKPQKRGRPTDGAELLARLEALEAGLVRRKLCARGSLLGHLARTGQGLGFPAAIEQWDGPAIDFAISEVPVFQRAAEEQLLWPHQVQHLARLFESMSSPDGPKAADLAKALGVASLFELKRNRFEQLEAQIKAGQVPGLAPAQ